LENVRINGIEDRWERSFYACRIQENNASKTRMVYIRADENTTDFEALRSFTILRDVDK
jgi:hypothetical protein